MKIAMLAPLVTPLVPAQMGGSQAFVCDLAAELGAQNEVVLFASKKSSLPGRLGKVKLVELDVDPAGLQDTLYRHGQDSVVTAGLRRAYRVAANAAGAGFDVVHVHGFDPPAPGSLAGCAPAVVQTLHLPPTNSMTAALNEARAAKGRFLVTCVSETQAALWRHETTIDAVIPNGLPVGEINWSERHERYALFAGRLSPEKGAHLSFEIARRAGLALKLAGPVYDQAYFDTQIAPLLGEAEYLGSLDRKELWWLMSKAAVVIAPHLWDEPFGLVAAEAAAAGTPVACSRRGGLSEIVKPNVTGEFFDPFNTEDAAAATSAATKLDRKAIRRYAKRRFDIRQTAAAYLSLYKGAIDSYEASKPSRR